jgi:post-segregation antitoxin (ccd killing protein)
MATPLKYSKVKVIKITDIQHQTLQKMKSYNIDVGRFIRDAIAEKIKREHQDLIPKVKSNCPF